MSEAELGIFTTDAELCVRSWNEWLVQATGIPAARAHGQPLVALVPDLERRGLLARFLRVLSDGVVEVLAPAFHHYLIACPPRRPSPRFEHMQQSVTLAPLREGERIVGLIVTVEDVTARLEREHELAARLQHPDEVTRLRAAQQAAREAPNAQMLAGALGDSSWRVRQVVVNGLAHRGDGETVAALVHALREEHRNPSVLNSALQALALSDVDVVTPLAECLRSPDPDLRVYAALALGEQRHPAAVTALLGALNDPDTNVRFHAIESLGRRRAVEALEPLLAIAESRDFYLAFPAIEALIRIGAPAVAPRLVPLLADELLRVPTADALGVLGDQAVVPPLTALLNTPGAPTRAIVHALAALYDRYEANYQEGGHIADLARQGIEPAGAQNVLDALGLAGSQDLRALALVLGWLEGAAVERALAQLLAQPTARKEVIEALVRHGRHTSTLLAEQLASEDLETRQAAVIALGRLGDSQAVPALIDVLAADPELAIVTAGALAKIGDRRAFEPMLALLGHREAAVRQAAIATLNSLGHPELAARTYALLDDPDPRVRESAVKIAGYFGYADCLERVLARCEDEDEGVRRAAVEHLPYFEDARVLGALQRVLATDAPAVRAAAVRALGHVDDPVAGRALVGALQDADAWVRYFAARALGRLGDHDALTALAGLAHADPASQVRITAMEALGRIGGARAVAVLAPLVENPDDDLARAALTALGQVGHPDALPPLLAALRAPEAARRIDAVRAVGTRGGAGTAEMLQWAAAADPDARVAHAAIEALAQMRTPEAIDALIELAADVTRREACITVLMRLDDEQSVWLARGLAHSSVAVRRAVVDVLARMKRQQASALLLQALDDASAEVRLAAIRALSQLGSRLAEPRLGQLAHGDPDVAVRRAAQTALQR